MGVLVRVSHLSRWLFADSGGAMAEEVFWSVSGCKRAAFTGTDSWGI